MYPASPAGAFASKAVNELPLASTCIASTVRRQAYLSSDGAHVGFRLLLLTGHDRSSHGRSSADLQLEGAILKATGGAGLPAAPRSRFSSLGQGA